METMEVCLVAFGYGQFTGLCVFGAFRKVASVLAFAGLRVKLAPAYIIISKTSYQVLRPVYTTKIMRIECELIRINCVHTEFTLSQFELKANSPSEVV